MKQRIFGLIAILTGVALALAAIEVMAIVWVRIDEGRFVSASELYNRTQNSYVRDVTRRTSCLYVDRLFPHPYLGFVHHGNGVCGFHNVNNVGLFNADFPTLKRTDRYTILLTGGSVASQLAQFDPPPAPRYLEDELNEHYVSPNGKPFLVLNGGAGAWKEPQPFILFALNAQAIDAVITLEGLNEYYMFRDFVRERLEWPLDNFTQVNPLAADDNFGDAAIAWVAGRIASKLRTNSILGNSLAAYLIVRGVETLAKGKGGTSRKRTTIDGLFALPPDIIGNDERVYEVQLGLYRKYHREFEALARTFGVKTAYFLQPCSAWGKILSPEEKAVAGDTSYVDLYRRVVGDMTQQRSLGLPVFDLGDLFADVRETIYADDVHFIRAEDGESLGYTIMAKRVASDLAKAWNLQPKSQ